DYADVQGTRRLKTFARKKDADGWAAKTSVSIEDGIHVADSASITVKEAGALWLESGKALELERTTLDQRRQHLTEHIEPFLGARSLQRLTTPVLRQFQERLRAEPPGTLQQACSPAMIKRVTVSLGSILADAQERGLVGRNVVKEMNGSRPRGRRRRNGERK